MMEEEKLIVCAFYNQASEAELERMTEEKQRQLRLRWQKRGQMLPSERETVQCWPNHFDYNTVHSTLCYSTT